MFTLYHNLPYIGSFIAGILTFVSPCILPLIPSYLAFVAGNVVSEEKSQTAKFSLLVKTILFVSGFTVIFTLLGMSASAIGSLLISHQRIISIIGGVVVIIFGLHIMGIFTIPFLYYEKRVTIKKRFNYFGCFLLGVAFASGWTPCVGPILGSILLFASTNESVYKGGLLLLIYSLGIGIPFIVFSILTESFLKTFKKIKKYYRTIEIASGLLLIFFGILLITNKLQIITNFFLKISLPI